MSDEGKDNIKIGIIGLGSMGKGLLYQSHVTPGIECAAVCDIDAQRCINALASLQLPYRMAANSSEVADAIASHCVAVCENGELLSQCQALHAVVEASNSIGAAGRHAITALENHKHLILMNSEIDLTFGPLLSLIAGKNGVVCTSCDGDQYGVLKHIIDDIRFWGFDLVMAGNIKGFLDRYANPTTIIPEADKRNLAYRMCTSYTDGTKLNIEMAIIANACGLVAETPGMRGPRAAHVKDVFQCFDFDLLWENRRPFVDYILGAEPGGGVFVIGHCDNSYQKDMLSYYKMGSGPYYLFYRPYHLCHIEAMGTIIRAVSEGRAFLSPDHGLQTNVYAYAKRDLSIGERLDGVGGYTCYGKIENLKDNLADPGLPICLADDVVLHNAVGKDRKLLMSDVAYDPGRIDFKLYSAALEQSVSKGGSERHSPGRHEVR
ncbi:MAG: homoserine dehydrogenase [Dehalococcoidia bacterium]